MNHKSQVVNSNPEYCCAFTCKNKTWSKNQILMTFDAGFIILEIWFYPSLLYKWPAQDVWNSAALLPVYFFWKEPARYLFPFCSSWIVWIYCNYPKNLSTKQEFHQENVPADLDETPQITKCLGKITEIMKIIWT